MVGRVGNGAIYQNPSALLAEKRAENQNVGESKELSKTQKIDEIKESIKNGTYKVDLEKTSEKMALYLLS